MELSPDWKESGEPVDITNIGKIKSRLIARSLNKLLKLDRINSLYKEMPGLQGVAFIDALLSRLKIKYEISKEDLANIPEDGSFIVVGNHPYGGIDGLIMMSIFLKARPDFKMMVNYLLQQFPEIEMNTIGVNPFDNKRMSKGVNVKGIKQSLNMLRNGVPIGIFPAGEVSALHIHNMKISDKMWHPVVGKLITKSEARVVPVYFSGHNSITFNLLGLINPNLRTARLPSELFNKTQTVKVRIGKPISVHTTQLFEDNDQLLRFLRAKTYSLGSGLDIKPFYLPEIIRRTPAEEIIKPTPVSAMQKEVDKLAQGEELLFTYKSFKVFIASAVNIPQVLREITRLREVTFREVGEGTNHSYDMDEFDVYYKHLFIWDEEEQAVVGAYRIGEGRKLYQRFGKKGFYLHTLFKFTGDFNDYFPKSLELGRSFIVKAYQRKPHSLMLLWKGINEFVKRNPEYEYLIGPVSISNSYSKLSKDLIVDYITRNHYDEKLAKFVTPRKRFKYQFKGEGKELRNMEVTDMKFLDQLIADIEPAQMKLPVLLKKYLSQNARIIAFNIDPAFSNSLDGLLVLRLEEVPAETFAMVQ